MADGALQPGDVLGGRYEIRSELGRGGMATVYRGADLRLHRPVAVKVFRDTFADAVDPQRTTQEMRLLAAVNHPSVVAVLDASNGDGDHGAFLVMELVVGADLGALLHRARGPLAADFARRIVADVAGALAALHAQGVVHRDVKPANILVPDGAHAPTAAVAAKLTDFGIAQLIDGARLTGPESILGTAAYLSPEQVRGTPPRPESDVYSLGLVLLEALTGARAFPGPAAEAAMARLHRPPALPPDASPALADLLSRMTALDPAHRPAAADVAALLREQLRGGVTAPDSVQTAPTPIAGLQQVAPAPVSDDETRPHVPLLTPSRGMPLGTGRVATVTGGAGAIAARDRRRFPTVLAVAASVLAAAVAGVAVTAFTATSSAPPPAAADAPSSSGAPVPAAADPSQRGTVADFRTPVVPRRSRSTTPTPSAAPSTPIPSATSSTLAPTPSEDPVEQAPAEPEATASMPVAPPSSEPAAPPSATTAPSTEAPPVPSDTAATDGGAPAQQVAPAGASTV